MQKRHTDRKQYFKEQALTTEKYVIPYVQQALEGNKNRRILEIGCGEAGNLLPFVKMGYSCVGVDLSRSRIQNARTFFAETLPKSDIKLIHKNMYDMDEKQLGKFDLILLRDVIEHIPNQQVFLKHLKQFLKADGLIFFGFPPWLMPYGGHQQICKHKILSKLPFFHLLPSSIYGAILKRAEEKETTVKELLEIKQTGITIERFLSIVKAENYKVVKSDFYFINPNYETKFGLKPRKLNKLIAAIPVIRNFTTSCFYCLIGLK